MMTNTSPDGTSAGHLRWDESLRTGIRTIDLQHHELIDAINEFDHVCRKAAGTPLLDDAIARLSAYAIFHFETEEALIRACVVDAAHVAQHGREHGQFVEQLAAFEALGNEERHAKAADMLAYLKHWLVAHIMKTDKELASLVLG